MSKERVQKAAHAYSPDQIGQAAIPASPGAHASSHPHLHGRTHIGLFVAALRTAFDAACLATTLGTTLRDLERGAGRRMDLPSRAS